VSVVLPPPDFKPPDIIEKGSKVKYNSLVNTGHDWTSKQSQKSKAAATSLIGSRLKSRQEQRKELMNTNLVLDTRSDEKVTQVNDISNSEETLERRNDLLEVGTFMFQLFYSKMKL